MGRGPIPIVSYFCRFWDFDISMGENTFFKKCLNSGLVSEKNTLNFSLQWGAEGIRPKCDISCLFYNWSLRAGVVGSDLNWSHTVSGFLAPATETTLLFTTLIMGHERPREDKFWINVFTVNVEFIQIFLSASLHWFVMMKRCDMWQTGFYSSGCI